MYHRKTKDPSIIRGDKPAVAITIDDFEWDTSPHYLTAEEKNRRMLAALRTHHLQAAIFVNGQYVDEGKGPQLLRTWDREGHIIGNHTYSHDDFNDPKITLQAFAADIRRNEEFLKPCRHFRKLFRYPFLHEGNTLEKRNRLRRILSRWGYRPAPVTITTSDWAIDDRLRQRLIQNPHQDIRPYREFYLDHVAQRAIFYENLAKRVIHRAVPHTLLLHYTLLNALFLGDVLQMFLRRGWRLISAGEPFADPLFRLQTEFFPSHGSLLWTLARERGLSQGIIPPDDSGRETMAQMMQQGL